MSNDGLTLTGPKELFEQFSAELMDMYPVSTVANSPKNDSEICIKKIDVNTLFNEKL